MPKQLIQKEEEHPLSMHDALENLSTIASMEVDSHIPLGVVLDNKLVIQEEDFSTKTDELLPDSAMQVVEIIKQSYEVIKNYLFGLISDKDTDWSSQESREGIQAIMVLVGETADKLNDYLSLFDDFSTVDDITETNEYQQLQDIYLKQIIPQFEKGLEGGASWEKEWSENDQALSLDIDKRGLNNFETIKKDREYELFYLLSDEGKPFFTPHLLRNVKLVCDFDESKHPKLETDPLLHIRNMQDRDMQAGAKQILVYIEPFAKSFLDAYKKKKKHSLGYLLNEALMALMLCSNTKNLIQNTIGKSSLQYFEDFHGFLRKCLEDKEYKTMLAYPDNYQDEYSQIMLLTLHQLCRAFFLRSSGVIAQMESFIHLLRSKAEEIKPAKKLEKSFWNDLLQEDDSIRFLLKFYPNGPLFKILDVIREEEEKQKQLGYDPILLGNYPHKLFEISYDKKTISIIHTPSPTKQLYISKAEIADEFFGFLRSNFLEKKKQKFLMINLQDRTSWKEYPRAHLLEELQKQVEFKDSFDVVSLTKDTIFYHQSDVYIKLSDSKDFMKTFEKQLLSEEDCGFFFPKQMKGEKFSQFISSVMPLIHKHFFNKKETLTRKERQDFIEIFYLFLIAKLLEFSKDPNMLSFTCKDSVDIGAVQTAAFYGFIKLFSMRIWTKEEKEYFHFLLYAPALFFRERAVDAQRVYRIISALALIDKEMQTKGSKVIKEFAKLYKNEFFNSLIL